MPHKRKLTPEGESLRASLPMRDMNFSVPEAAAVLSIGRNAVHNLIMDGKLKSQKIGFRRVIPGRVLEKFMADLARTAA